MYPNSIKNLIESFKFLPGIGEKTAERLTFAVLELEDEQADFFSESIINLKKIFTNVVFAIHLLKMSYVLCVKIS